MLCELVCVHLCRMGLVGVANRNDEPIPRICKPAKTKVPEAEQNEEADEEAPVDSEQTGETTESMLFCTMKHNTISPE